MEINKDVFVQQGILDCQVDQLINFSHTDPQVQGTSDPKRFFDRQSFNQWLEQGKIIYTLTDNSKNLLGIVWFSQKEAPVKTKANFTFAIRIYGPARGQGLSYDFMKITFDDLVNRSSDKSKIVGFWLETSVDNIPAIKTYEKFGFQKISQKDNRIVMILDYKF